jgi:hypothetical protein
MIIILDLVEIITYGLNKYEPFTTPWHKCPH